MRHRWLNRGISVYGLWLTAIAMVIDGSAAVTFGQSESLTDSVATDFPPETIQFDPPPGPDYFRNGLSAPGVLWLSVEAVFGQVRESKSLIGSPDATQNFRDFYAASGGALGGDRVGTEFLEPGLVGQKSDDDLAPGLRVKLGWRNEENGGVELSGLWLDDVTRSWSRGIGGLDAGANPDTVRVTAAIPLFDGADGYAVPFDQYYGISIRSDVRSLGGDYAPWGFWAGTVLLQPTAGMRYFSIDEGFAFAGADSGLDYEYEQNGVPIPESLDPPVVAFPPYQSSLSSDSETSLVGPVMGLNVTTTGKKVRFFSQSRGGWMYAESDLSLRGQGMGNGFAPGFDPLAAFADSRSSSYDSGYFEQSLGADIDLGRIFNGGLWSAEPGALILRLGCSLTVFQDVARPLDAVVWNGFPLSPELKDNTVRWQLQTFNSGIVFQY